MQMFIGGGEGVHSTNIYRTHFLQTWCLAEFNGFQNNSPNVVYTQSKFRKSFHCGGGQWGESVFIVLSVFTVRVR